MDQSKSSETLKSKTTDVVLPKRTFTTEFFVGLFAIASIAAGGYLAVGLGELQLGPSNQYTVYAEFDNISGLKSGASVEIAGVPIGEVSDITLKDPQARVTLKVDNAVRLRDDDIASIRTKGIIGDRYVKISRGASSTNIEDNGLMTETESVVDLEDVIGKIVHSMTSGDEEEEEGTAKDKKDSK